MSDLKTTSKESTQKNLTGWLLGGVAIMALFLLAAGWFMVFRVLPVGHVISSALAWLFATNSVHTTWYITRSAGWVAYFLLWFSMVWGLAIPTKFFEKFISPTFAVDFHEYISLLAIGFITLHVGVLLIDQYLPFTLTQILVPFMSSYRPLWVGLGVIGAYLSLLVTITFYMRKKIGQKRFKSIHVLSLVGYLAVVLHAFFAGSDSSLSMAQLTYLGTFLVVVFLTAYWLINTQQIRAEKERRSINVGQTRSIER